MSTQQGNVAAGAPSRESRVPLLRHIVRDLGLVDYEPTWRAMQRFTDQRGPDTPDEIWFLEHPPVFTLGMNASRDHVLAAGDIPVVQIDRGGQVTYHGPGQLVVYPLVDLRRAALGVRDIVTALERSVIDYAAELGIAAECRKKRRASTSTAASWRASASACAAAPATTASLSTSAPTSSRSAASIPAAIRVWR